MLDGGAEVKGDFEVTLKGGYSLERSKWVYRVPNFCGDGPLHVHLCGACILVNPTTLTTTPVQPLKEEKY